MCTPTYNKSKNFLKNFKILKIFEDFTVKVKVKVRVRVRVTVGVGGPPKGNEAWKKPLLGQKAASLRRFLIG